MLLLLLAENQKRLCCPCLFCHKRSAHYLWILFCWWKVCKFWFPLFLVVTISYQFSSTKTFLTWTEVTPYIDVNKHLSAYCLFVIVINITYIVQATSFDGAVLPVAFFCIALICNYCFYRAMLSIRRTSHGPVSVRLSVRHKSEFYRNGWTNRAGFWHVSFLPPVVHCVKRKFGLRKFSHGISIVETCYQLSSRKVDKSIIPPSSDARPL